MHGPPRRRIYGDIVEHKQLVDTINIALQTALANLHTATIARVERVNATTIDVQPVINRVVNGESIKLPVFTKVPPLFLQGGSSYTAHPIAVGDYCLLIFTERCFDRWYEGQDEQQPAEFRMHDYSDGIAIVGINPRADAITIPGVITRIGDTYEEGDTTHVGNRIQTGNHTQVGNRTQTGNHTQVGNFLLTGDTYEEGDTTHVGNRTQTGDHIQVGNFILTGDMYVIGNIFCTGTIAAANFIGMSGLAPGGPLTSTVNIETTGDVKAGDISLNSHTHTQSGGGETEEPS